MRYENEKCPVCGEAFKADDDVVVCPYCATPHHRNCYNELGKCANEEKHKEGFVWQKTSDTPPIIEEKTEEPKDYSVCVECGTKNKKNALVCSNCGSVINAEIRKELLPQNVNSVFVDGRAVDNNEFIDEENTVSVKEAASFIQKNRAGYIKVFLDSKRTKRNPKFNFAAFLLGPYWFFFRKMYKTGFGFLGINFALNLFFLSFFNNAFAKFIAFSQENYAAISSMNPDAAITDQLVIIFKNCIYTNKTAALLCALFGVAMLGINIFAGLKGNKFYLNFVKNSIAKIRKVTSNEGMFYTYLFAKGGVSFAMPVLAYMALSYLSSFITVI